ncbi:MAG: TrkA family potassium uptake protein [Clostridiales bacterium]|nr:TrkA family potassium uptake protein [Clostridiales bacterium]
MVKKHILVLGLKSFGLSIVKQLSKYTCEILAIDKSMERVEVADEYATQAIQVDMHDLDKMEDLSLNSFDVAIITLDSIEESIMAALVFQEKGIPQIIVKSASEMHKKILEKMDIDKIISPETEMGIKLAKSIMNESVIDAINFSDEYSIVEINALEKWLGKTIGKLNLRENYGLNVLCVKNADKDLEISPNEQYVIEEKDTLVAIAENKKLDESGLL